MTKPMHMTRTNLELSNELGAVKGWMAKYKKKAEFWEEEARRLGSTAVYRIYPNRGKTGVAIQGSGAQVVNWRDIVEDVPRETPPPADDYKDAIAQDRFAALRTMHIEHVEEVVVVPWRISDLAVDSEEPPVPPATTKHRVDLSQLKLPSGYQMAPQSDKQKYIGERKAIHVDTGRFCIIKRGVKGPPDSAFPHKAYKVYYPDNQTSMYEMARDIWLLERIPDTDDILHDKGQ